MRRNRTNGDLFSRVGMEGTTSIDFGQVARELDLPVVKIQRTVELLDQGNTVPFITRYRKDQTGGLDEEHIRRIEEQVIRLRLLAERKQTILKSIESQGKLTPELAEQINTARSTKRLEDLYLPFKPNKQTLATQARARGLEPLAREVYEADPAAADLPTRAAEFVNPDKQLKVLADVLQGVGHLLAEKFSERADLRGRLRRIFERSGKLVCAAIGGDKPEAKPTSESAESEIAAASSVAEQDAEQSATIETTATSLQDAYQVVAVVADQSVVLPEPEIQPTDGEGLVPPLDSDQPHGAALALATVTDLAATTSLDASSAALDSSFVAEPLLAGAVNLPTTPEVAPRSNRREKKKGKQQEREEKAKGESPFQDYFGYNEPLGRVPPHRVLAINRGERAKALRVRIEADFDAMHREAEELLVPPDHPHAEFLRTCARDALQRLVIPSLEREIRRELTDMAEFHAVDVFARNLRKLLLQPPVRGRRVLALDPGYRSGCKLSILDEFGNILGQGVIHIVGKEDRRAKGREQLATMLRQHQVSVVAIGNGTACREAEQLVAAVIGEELKDLDVAYVVVNEAGASVYSTSPLGREELPQFDALLRSAVSIGRRLLDPLSELVKINPANIGVGMYQHDVKANHLRNSLDSVVESCVNYVGVDVNSASPALLRYVSGLNQLTARRVYEHRRERGPFTSREQFKEVSGFGDAAFVQSAGFLKIAGGDNPLDATWIHPESYEVARRVLEKLNCSLEELAGPKPPPPTPAPPVTVPVDQPASSPATNDENAATADATNGEPQAVQTEKVDLTAVVAPGESAGVESVPAAPAPVEAAVPVEIVTSPAKPPIHEILAERASKVDFEAFAAELGVGKLLLMDILAALTRPGRDPRDDFPPPIFRRGFLKLEDLKPGIELSGTVLNVVDFGAFVDIGLSDSGLIHISRLADRYVRDPHEVVSVGDTLKVWVVEVDKQRRRVSLTAIDPNAPKPAPPPRRDRGASGPPRPAGQNAGGRPAGASQGQRPSGGQGQRPSGGQGQQRTGQQRSGPPQGGRQGGKPSGPPRTQAPPRKPPKPKPVTPLTKEMEEGKAPLRSFSDLAQFFDKKKKSGEGEEPKPQ